MAPRRLPRTLTALGAVRRAARRPAACCASSATCSWSARFEAPRRELRPTARSIAAIFTLSLDFELIWGTLDRGPDAFREACERERAVVVDRLLALLAEFEISATWCILGHLFLDACAPQDGRKHPEIVPPRHEGIGDWFEHDPCGTEESDPIFYGKSLVDRILACPVPQEIGCHSFSHPMFGDPGCSRETASTELAECVRLAGERGLDASLLRVSAEPGGPPRRPARPWVHRLPRPRADLVRARSVAAAAEGGSATWSMSCSPGGRRWFSRRRRCQDCGTSPGR